MIQIRDNSGRLLAQGDTLSEAISRLVETIEQQTAKVEAFEDLISHGAVNHPDLSATAPEHHKAFSAGWRACREFIARMSP